MVLRIGICEDNEKDMNILKGYIDALASKYPYFSIKTDMYRSGNDILLHYDRASKSEHYDMIFFDKDLGDADGIEIAHEIRNKYDMNVLFVYVTNFSQFLNSASETDMFRYLTKPVPQDKFNNIFNFAVRKINLQEKTFHFTSNYDKFRVFARDILYFERDEPNLTTYIFMTDGKQYTTPKRLSVVLEELKDYGFICPHSTYVVNLAYVREVKRDWLYMDNDKEISISRARTTKVKQQFLEHDYRRSDV